MMKSMKVVLILLCTMLISVGSVNAFPLYPGSGTIPGTQFEDNDFDYWTDNDQDGKISQGDVLTALVEFENVIELLGTATYSLNTSIDELVGYSVLEVKTVNANGSMIMGEYNNIPLVQFWTGGNIDLNVISATQDPTLAAGLAAITDGTFLWSFSIDPNDPDTFWNFIPLVANADDPAIVRTLLSSTKVGVVNYALNQVGGEDIFNAIYNPAYVADDGLVDLVGSGDILGGLGLTNAFARSDIDVVLNPVPEPATMGLFGLGLLGLAYVGRRRSRK